MEKKVVKTPDYWKKEHYQPLVEAETIYGNKVLIPKRFMNVWRTARTIYEEMRKRGLDHRDYLRKSQPTHYSVVQVCFEIYEEDN